MEGAGVAIAKITGQGLTSIAVLVALLWACVIGERVIAGRANAGAAEVYDAMRTLRLKKQREPAAVPGKTEHHRARPAMG